MSGTQQAKWAISESAITETRLVAREIGCVDADSETNNTETDHQSAADVAARLKRCLAGKTALQIQEAIEKTVFKTMIKILKNEWQIF